MFAAGCKDSTNGPVGAFGRAAVGAWLALALQSSVAGELPEGPRAPDNRALSPYSDDPARRFDFWIGEWSVDLEARGEDGAYSTLTRARAQIHSILGGRALLELWDSEPIKGFSLRYFIQADSQWVLWLNWPSENRSRTNRMTGAFRHGRAEFNGTFTTPDGIEMSMVYTFSDISPWSLRWDDRYSSDGGASWRGNWIMRFERTAVEPAWPEAGAMALTYAEGKRCTRGEFRALNAVAGRYSGSGKSGRSSGAVTAKALRVLDGCALIFLADIGVDGQDDLFIFRTYNTEADRYEDLVLGAEPDEGAKRYSSRDAGKTVDERNAHRLSWTLDGDLLQLSLQTAITNGWARKMHFELVRD